MQTKSSPNCAGALGLLELEQQLLEHLEQVLGEGEGRGGGKGRSHAHSCLQGTSVKVSK